VNLAEILSIEQLSDDVYEAVPPGDQLLYGGCSVALALAAAAKTVPEGMSPKSVRSSFLRAGRWGTSTMLEVDRWSDGRSFATRHVSVLQEGRVIAAVTVLFHVPGVSADWQAASCGDVPPPESSFPTPLALPDPCFELRTVNPPPVTPISGSTHPYWARATAPVGDGPMSRAASLAFMSDYLVVFSMHLTGLDLGESPMIRTLTHDLWFHRPFAGDDWLLYLADPVTMSEGRGLIRGSVYTRDRQLAASFAQEVVLQV
jgi:acyl-CoA thioesterase-2